MYRLQRSILIPMAEQRYVLEITGIVQGVGFRPFIYSFAKSMNLKGWVSNTGKGVIIEFEGSDIDINDLTEKIKEQAPPLSIIKDIQVKELTSKGYKNFEIRHSIEDTKKQVFISPDVSICSDCANELYNSNDHRYMYPFINCTNCGPRFTIIRDIPYDRKNTTMNIFPMCEKCEGEYTNPLDRRYHAQPVSCYDCGPSLKLLDSQRNEVKTDDYISFIRKEIMQGKIAAIKGIGGYHLACDAYNTYAVGRLRQRKHRDEKPFALMTKDISTAYKHCCINNEEKKLIESFRKPIVLLQKREDCVLPDQIAPGNPFLGLMLPYTPLHMLIFDYPIDNTAFTDTLVMTSANISSEPIVYKDEEALENLGGIADYFLTNNREIYIRTDDSVTRVFRNKEYIIRRSRGYVPLPITADVFDSQHIPSILACGGELKNTFCLNKENEFYPSHHIGDLENAETLSSFEEGIEHFKNMFNIEPEVIAYDLHPEYLSTKYAMDSNITVKIPVQHHHAHVASCMAENGINGDVIGVAFDGTGYGEDGHIWGGEFFTGNYAEFKREGHFDYVSMPGGERAIKEPWRMAVSCLEKCFADGITDIYSLIDQNNFFESVDRNSIKIILNMIQNKLNSPLTSSAGRLFDAVSAMLGIRKTINYEGQAAIELEQAADKAVSEAYDFELKQQGNEFVINTALIFSGLMHDMKNGTDKGISAMKFHNSVVNIITAGCEMLREKTGLNRVILSGGVFQNMTLLEKTLQALEIKAFEAYTHSLVPSNDGGISLGQAVIAVARTVKEA